MSTLMTVGILAGGVVAVAVTVMVVAVVMLMRTGILVGGVAVVAVGMVSFSKEQCLFVTEVECWRVRFGLVRGDILDCGGGFVVVVVEKVNDLKLEVGDAVRIVWCRVNEELHCWWRLSQKSQFQFDFHFNFKLSTCYRRTIKRHTPIPWPRQAINLLHI